MRLVSLACSNTEIVAALGCADRLVGVDSHSDHPPDVVARLPRMGPDLEIDVDAVARLEPDLVLASLTVPGHETVVEGCEAAGLPLLVLDPLSLADVYEGIGQIAEALGVESRGRELVAEMRAALAPPPEAGGGAHLQGDAAPSLLIQWWPKPVIAPGRRSWADEVIRAAGGRNALVDDRPSRPLTDDEVAALAPDAIVVSWCGVDPARYRPEVVLRNPAFRSVPAVVHDRVVPVPEAFLGRPGPRLIEGVRALRRIVESCAPVAG